MTKHQAISAMMTGQQVTHPLFAKDEYLFMKGDFRIYRQDDSYASDEKFWNSRKGDEWQTDWKICGENPKLNEGEIYCVVCKKAVMKSNLDRHDNSVSHQNEVLNLVKRENEKTH